MCTGWWGPSGLVQAWFGRYKAFLTNEAMTYEASDSSTVALMQIMDSPTGGYRPLYSLEAANKYTAKAAALMQQRPDKDTLSTGWVR
jgi:hypothetical protein